MTPHPRRWLILYVLLAAEVMDLLDSTIVNVAVPRIRADLGASAAQLQWVVGAYPLAVAAGLMVGARLGDLLGRRSRVHGSFLRVRARAVGGRADRLPRRPGSGRRRDDPAGLRHPARDLPARRAAEGVRRLR